jgi:hypothetical protein
MVLDCLIAAWAILVSPYSEYGDNWAVFPVLASALLIIVAHVTLVVCYKPRWAYMLYALLHLSWFSRPCS